MGPKLSTGIDGIDRHLSGGLEPGCTVALLASPAMQSERLLHELIAHRPTLYLTTLREPDSVREDLERVANDDVWVEFVGTERPTADERLEHVTTTGDRNAVADGQPGGVNGHRTVSDDQDSVTGATSDILDTTYETLHSVNQQANVILDPVNPLEESRDRERYREVLNELKSTMLATGGVGVLHCITHRDPPSFRDVTLAIADVVWELDLVSLQNRLEYQLTIPKNRFGPPVLEENSIVFDSRVWVDESRNI